ncbi:hypothetical protein SAMN02745247_02836 [Butyrivibrio hungatei DSM 14810]|uniref:Adenylyl/Guanylyl and SMODS C-terminal sensor domain-containing protein n=1 Tax=Butyrivibrio hungatei DSM 14810 TaxID=1121132 RepID=A0A1M7T1Y9_9FIRM|nr:nucleotidyltransferase [Butyrivibrio hungatei]SHN64682.1 hypothetical protein SAMN02745247_02836 [Butyrivibrio hungatei DSM 14810]
MIKYSKQLMELLKDIEVPDSDYEKAVSRYEAVANYINNHFEQYGPELFLQGSFKLGTAIKPLTDDGAYDIDIVCCMKAYSKKQISQNRLKKVVGEAVVSYANANSMKEEPHDGKRCWTLSYVDEHNFHLDILPSVVNDGWSNVIAFTDKRNPNYYDISNNWNISNPKDYYKWFIEISQHSLYKKQFAAVQMRAIEKVPDYKVKTPLQRAIQLFKRHAEVMFENDMEHKPSSIIITTLSAKAFGTYGSNIESFEDLLSILSNKLILFLDRENGKECVKNPVNQNENLSEKWMNDNTYYQEFLKWQKKLSEDFSFDRYETRAFAYSNLEGSLKRKHSIISQNERNVLAIPHHKKPKWRLKLSKDVRISAKYKLNGGIFHPLKNGTPLMKQVDLRFEIQADNLRSYDIFWQVTNTGYEASSVGQLRGDFYNSDIIEGKRVRTESTKYKGDHYVEAYIVKDEICYGKSEPFLVIVV